MKNQERRELELRESRVTDANVAANWTDVPTPGYQSRKSMDLKQQETASQIPTLQKNSKIKPF